MAYEVSVKFAKPQLIAAVRARVQIALVFAATLTISCCYKRTPVTCEPPSGVSSVLSQTDLPSAVAAALAGRIGNDLVPPGEPFDATDIVETGRNRRLMFIWNVGRRWVVATERGGVGYSNPIFAFDLSADGRTATLAGQDDVFPETVCETAVRLIGVEPAKPPA